MAKVVVQKRSYQLLKGKGEPPLSLYSQDPLNFTTNLKNVLKPQSPLSIFSVFGLTSKIVNPP